MILDDNFVSLTISGLLVYKKQQYFDELTIQLEDAM